MSQFMENMIADRLGGKMFGKDTTIYKFEKIKRAKRAAVKENPGVELIDMGVGEPDAMAHDDVVKVLQLEATKKENRFYSDNGIDEFKNAAVGYMKKRFNIDLTATQLNHCIGSKPALSLLPMTLINPGDVALMTVPGYPVSGTMTKYLGGDVYNLPLTKENNFLPVLEDIPEDIKKRAKFLYMNYPNNPTGAIATKEFYEKLVKFAKDNSIAIISDAAYIELTYGEAPLSFLSIPGAIDVGVEIHSLSKSFNMTGWRLGFVCGNEHLVKAYATVKDNNDSGQFIPIQKAGAYCLDNPKLIEPTKHKYARRLVMMANVLRKHGFTVNEPKGTFYLYFGVPKSTVSGRQFENAEQFCDFLIREKLISSVPWDDAGHFLRFSVTFDAPTVEAEERIAKIIDERLGTETYIF